MSQLEGITTLRALASISSYTNETVFLGLSMAECINLLTAVRECPWDIYADALYPREREHAARYGHLSPACLGRLEREFTS